MLNNLVHTGNVAAWENKSACTNDVSPLNQSRNRPRCGTIRVSISGCGARKNLLEKNGIVKFTYR